MQFITNGPDIPDTLLQAHEEGRVVFFTGAGISYPAGLPGFKGLVDEIYKNIGESPNTIEQKAYDREQYDATLNLLEQRIVGQRKTIRKALMASLKPNYRKKGAIDTHSAILQLARCREGALRLVTTNFDRVFIQAAKKTKQLMNSHAAPMLPIPKNSRWDGLVYLHGLLPKHEDHEALNRLVFTSGDFGLAYLTERWAARFVSELFRNYVVCFVGYSINDPVLRYMMDALAADRMLGEATPQAYALGDCEPGQEKETNDEWESKGVLPILYEVPSGTYDHSLLHNTLRVWAETYRDGIYGKERIVVDHALALPSTSTKQDNYVGRMLWALADKSGLPAKQFAKLNPVPSLKWLDAFSEKLFHHNDLERFGVAPNALIDSDLSFSLMNRPAPYTHSLNMSLASEKTFSTPLDDVMSHLSRWLLKHLNDPDLILWLSKQGSELHRYFSWQVENQLSHLARLKENDQEDELKEIRRNSPNAIPSPLMVTLWQLFLIGRVKSARENEDLIDWQTLFSQNGLTTTNRLMLRNHLTPKIELKEPFKWFGDRGDSDQSNSEKQKIEWDLVLASDQVHHFLCQWENEEWLKALPALIDDFQQLLLDALDIQNQLGAADEQYDRSHWDLPSIHPHWQNRGFHDWISLIELLRNAWVEVFSIDPERGTRIAQTWYQLSYPTFKRLALFAASQESCIDPDQWVKWLISDSAWYLWSVNTQRETMRLLVLQGMHISEENRVNLEAAIAAGPPHTMYRADFEEDVWKSIESHSTWLRFAKLREGAGSLSDFAEKIFNDLSIANPEWNLATNERDEFTHWMSSNDDPDYEENREIDIAPRKRTDLVNWLKQPEPKNKPFYENTWRDTCRTRFFHSFLALCDLSQEGVWPVKHWREAIQTWSEDGLIERSWKFAAPVVSSMANDLFKEAIHSISWWIEKISNRVDYHESVFLELSSRTLNSSFDLNTDVEYSVGNAINHPIGHTTTALLNFWFKRSPNDGDGLSDEIAPFFTQLCNTQVENYRHARVILASQLIALFRVDQSWTQANLLPLFDWNNNVTEAKAVWEGFLWSPRLYRPVLDVLKNSLLDTANHYSDLGEHKHQFTTFLTYTALLAPESYSVSEFKLAMEVLPLTGLEEVAQALVKALESSGEKKEDYWTNRIRPFWNQIWPKSQNNKTKSVANSFAHICVAARNKFEEAFSVLSPWLQPIDHPGYIVRILLKCELPTKHPKEVLSLLGAIIDGQYLVASDLGECLRIIRESEPNLISDPQYLRLESYARQRGN